MPSPENKQLPRPWMWVMAIGVILISIAIFVVVERRDLAERFGYAHTVAETTVKQDNTKTVKETVGLSPGARFARDALLVLAALAGLLIAAFRSYAQMRQAEATMKSAESAAATAQTTAQSATATLKHQDESLRSGRLATVADLMAKETSDGKPAVALRVNGINILGDLAINSPAIFLQQAVINLVAYIKDHAQLTAKPPRKEGQILAPRLLGEDVKAAFAVINALRESHKDRFPAADLDLSHQNFSCLNFNKGQIEGMRFFNWDHAVLQGVLLNETDLRGANLTSTDLRGAIFLRTKLNGAELQDANLRLAYLHGASMQGASLLGAKLSGAHFPYSDLRGADLWSARIHGACFSSGTRFGDTEMPLEGCIGKWAESDRQQCLEEIERLGVKPHSEVLRHVGETEFPSRDYLDGKIWGNQGWPHSIPRAEDTRWDFAQYEDGYAIAGILRNFGAKRRGYVKPFELERAKALRKQARDALNNGKLPKNIPEEWREWLARCADGGSHPDDSLPY